MARPERGREGRTLMRPDARSTIGWDSVGSSSRTSVASAVSACSVASTASAASNGSHLHAQPLRLLPLTAQQLRAQQLHALHGGALRARGYGSPRRIRNRPGWSPVRGSGHPRLTHGQHKGEDVQAQRKDEKDPAEPQEPGVGGSNQERAAKKLRRGRSGTQARES